MSNNNNGFNTIGENSTVSRRDQRRRTQRTTLIIIVAIAALMVVAAIVLAIAFAISNSDNDNPSGGPNSDGKVSWTTQIVSAQDVATGDLVLVNGTHQYQFPETELVAVTEGSGNNSSYKTNGGKMEKNALVALDQMLVAMANATGYKSAIIATGYRSYEDQQSLNSSTKAGYSDHHTGRLCAINASDATANQWLNENAHKYGFIVRYPEGKEGVTGVSGYTNAYRYVGVAHATMIKGNGWCLEEYVEYLKANVTDKTPLTFSDGSYTIYYYTVNGSATINVPTNYAYTVSGTNDGGIVVTVSNTPALQETVTDATVDTTPETSAGVFIP